MKIYKNAKIFTLNKADSYYENGYIKIEGDKIKEIGHISELTAEEKKKSTDVNGKIILPGMISAHSHFYGQFVRGMSFNEPMCNWQQILSRLWWKVDKKLTLKQSYYSALMGLIEGLKSGTTTYFDHQASPNSTEGVLDELERAVMESGARACFSYEVSDRDGKDHAALGIRENERFIKKCNKYKNPRIAAMFGLHASYTLSEETLLKAAEIGNTLNAGFHIHVAEDMADVAESYRIFDKHVVDRLYEKNIFTDKSILAHCVYVREPQWEVFRKSGVTVAHNCQSNTNNAVGISPVVGMLDAGVNVALGGDGYTYDLFHELSFAVILQRLKMKRPDVFSNNQILDMTFYNNSRLIKNNFGTAAGILEKGNYADFIILDYNPPTPLNNDNFLTHLLSGFSGKINSVVVAGEEVVKDGHCTLVDENEIFSKCREEAEKLWKSI